MNAPRCILLALLALAGGLTTAGCKAPPLNDKLSRTPYQRFDQLRGGDAPLREYDEVGRERTALRQRLSATRQYNGG